MIRPHSARWFEILVARDDAFVALEALARSGCVQIHTPDAMPSQVFGTTATALAKYAILAKRYQPYWPAAATHPLGDRACDRRAPADAISKAVRQLQAWSQQAEEVIRQLQQAQAQAGDLALTEQTLRALRLTRLDLDQIAQAHSGVTACIVALPRDSDFSLPDDVLTCESQGKEGERLLLVLGPLESISILRKAAIDAGGRSARLPDWILPSAEASLAQIHERQMELELRLKELQAKVDALARAHDLAHVLGDVLRAAWCFEHGGDIAMGEGSRGQVFARIRGWTIEPTRLEAALEQADARAIATFPPAPFDLAPPLVLRNPWWVRPFEFFTRLVGMPIAKGADPSVLLAFAVPLLFGYMFGDVGQGLVLTGVGMLFGHRLRVLRLLVPAGLAATIFGILFGAVFCDEASISPLWIAPLARPLLVLAVPIIGGAMLLLLGLLVNFLEAVWQGDLRRWMCRELPVLVTFLGLLLTVAAPSAWILAGTGTAGSLVAGALENPLDRRRFTNGFTGLVRTVGATLELLINTLSFARVGAFALAHAGLASAVIALAAAADSALARVAIIALGNAVILSIEGLVVSIQTTRLVLFEFFLRFFEKHGRAFRPLAPPPVQIKES